MHVPVLQVPNPLHRREIKFEFVDDFVIVFFKLVYNLIYILNFSLLKYYNIVFKCIEFILHLLIGK